MEHSKGQIQYYAHIVITLISLGSHNERYNSGAVYIQTGHGERGRWGAVSQLKPMVAAAVMLYRVRHKKVAP